MKVNLKIFMPMLSAVTQTSKMLFEFDGITAGDLLEAMVKKYGKRAADALYDRKGILDLEVQLLVNHKTWVTRENIDHKLNEGDRVQIMVMMGGG